MAQQPTEELDLTNLRKLPPRERSFTKKLNTTWVAVSVILAAIGAGTGYGVRSARALDRKADVSDLRTDHDRLVHLETRVDDIAAVQQDQKAEQDWTAHTLEQLSLRSGVNTRPIPTPRATPHPTETP